MPTPTTGAVQAAPPRARYRRGVTLERPHDDDPVEDHVVFLDPVPWKDYERLLELRGDRSVPRMTYLEGVLELMTPSHEHERIKSMVGRLVEVFCLERGVRFTPYGQWTLKSKRKRRGVEADECYVFGAPRGAPRRPHLAIEVFSTSGRLDKLEVYRRLGVREVWIWSQGKLTPWGLRAEAYVELPASAVLPGIDLAQLLRFVDRPTAYDAIRAYRRALRLSARA